MDCIRKSGRDLLPLQEAMCHVVDELDHNTEVYIQNDEYCVVKVYTSRVKLLDARVRDEGKVSQNRILPFSVY